MLFKWIGKYDTYKGSTLAYDDGVSYSFYLGKYDTYKGSTPSFTISINHDFGLGNMILIKDWHELNGKYGDEKIQGNMILTKDEE